MEEKKLPKSVEEMIEKLECSCIYECHCKEQATQISQASYEQGMEDERNDIIKWCDGYADRYCPERCETNVMFDAVYEYLTHHD